MGAMILIPIFLPVLAGTFLLLPIAKPSFGNDEIESTMRPMHWFTIAVLILSAGFAMYWSWSGENSFTLLELMKGIPIYFHVDNVGRLFVSLISVVWVLVGIYAFVYMKHEGRQRQFFGFYLIVYGVLMALSLSGNLVTMYLCYELMTITSMPMVLHSRSHESIMAALKYLFYSMCGAYCGLFGIFVLYEYSDTLTFMEGGVLNPTLSSGQTTLILAAVFVMLIGFGAKAGMFPLHAWLPAAHPVAPAPASAVMSGIIAKAGVLAIIRVVYYIVGPDFIRGTWVQYGWMTLALLTIFMGSMLAFREKVFKKRLAYSTVSQVSYVLFGLAVLDPAGMEGALLHVVFHALIKSALFLVAGAIIFKTGKSNVDQLEGIGKKMPKLMWCYTFAALALVGIPPFCGFISKWYLAEGALTADIGVFSWLGPIILLVSALLTAGYLITIVTNGFFPKIKKSDKKEEELEDKEKPEALEEKEEEKEETAVEAQEKEVPATETKKTDAPIGMLIPIGILSALTLILGIFPGQLISFVSEIAASVL